MERHDLVTRLLDITTNFLLPGILLQFTNAHQENVRHAFFHSSSIEQTSTSPAHLHIHY